MAPDAPRNMGTRLIGRYCPNCGYDISGTGSDRCAECGYFLGTGQILALDRGGYWALRAARLTLKIAVPVLLVTAAVLLVAWRYPQEYLNAHRWFHAHGGYWIPRIAHTGDNLAAVSLVFCALTAFLAFAVSLGGVLLWMLFARKRAHLNK